jgi:hypothetical protein
MPLVGTLGHTQIVLPYFEEAAAPMPLSFSDCPVSGCATFIFADGPIGCGIVRSTTAGY